MQTLDIKDDKLVINNNFQGDAKALFHHYKELIAQENFETIFPGTTPGSPFQYLVPASGGGRCRAIDRTYFGNKGTYPEIENLILAYVFSLQSILASVQKPAQDEAPKINDREISVITQEAVSEIVEQYSNSFELKSESLKDLSLAYENKEMDSKTLATYYNNNSAHTSKLEFSDDPRTQQANDKLEIQEQLSNLQEITINLENTTKPGDSKESGKYHFSSSEQKKGAPENTGSPGNIANTQPKTYKYKSVYTNSNEITEILLQRLHKYDGENSEYDSSTLKSLNETICHKNNSPTPKQVFCALFISAMAVIDDAGFSTNVKIALAPKVLDTTLSIITKESSQLLSLNQVINTIAYSCIVSKGQLPKSLSNGASIAFLKQKGLFFILNPHQKRLIDIINKQSDTEDKSSQTPIAKSTFAAPAGSGKSYILNLLAENGVACFNISYPLSVTNRSERIRAFNEIVTRGTKHIIVAIDDKVPTAEIANSYDTDYSTETALLHDHIHDLLEDIYRTQIEYFRAGKPFKILELHVSATAPYTNLDKDDVTIDQTSRLLGKTGELISSSQAADSSEIRVNYIYTPPTKEQNTKSPAEKDTESYKRDMTALELTTYKNAFAGITRIIDENKKNSSKFQTGTSILQVGSKPPLKKIPAIFCNKVSLRDAIEGLKQAGYFSSDNPSDSKCIYYFIPNSIAEHLNTDPVKGNKHEDNTSLYYKFSPQSKEGNGGDIYENKTIITQAELKKGLERNCCYIFDHRNYLGSNVLENGRMTEFFIIEEGNRSAITGNLLTQYGGRNRKTGPRTIHIVHHNPDIITQIKENDEAVGMRYQIKSLLPLLRAISSTKPSVGIKMIAEHHQLAEIEEVLTTSNSDNLIANLNETAALRYKQDLVTYYQNLLEAAQRIYFQWAVKLHYFEKNKDEFGYATLKTLYENIKTGTNLFADPREQKAEATSESEKNTNSIQQQPKQISDLVLEIENLLIQASLQKNQSNLTYIEQINEKLQEPPTQNGQNLKSDEQKEDEMKEAFPLQQNNDVNTLKQPGESAQPKDENWKELFKSVIKNNHEILRVIQKNLTIQRNKIIENHNRVIYQTARNITSTSPENIGAIRQIPTNNFYDNSITSSFYTVPTIISEEKQKKLTEELNQLEIIDNFLFGSGIFSKKNSRYAASELTKAKYTAEVHQHINQAIHSSFQENKDYKELSKFLEKFGSRIGRLEKYEDITIRLTPLHVNQKEGGIPTNPKNDEDLHNSVIDQEEENQGQEIKPPFPILERNEGSDISVIIDSKSKVRVNLESIEINLSPRSLLIFNQIANDERITNYTNANNSPLALDTRDKSLTLNFSDKQSLYEQLSLLNDVKNSISLAINPQKNRQNRSQRQSDDHHYHNDNNQESFIQSLDGEHLEEKEIGK